MEGLVDRFAEAVRRDPAEIRRQNFVPPDAFPYRSGSGGTYDKMDYRKILDRALATADYSGLRRSSPEEGPEERTGVGIACSMLMGGFGPSRAAVEAGMDFGGYETVQVRMDRDGKAEVLTGMSGQGQGIETALAQICADSLGLHPLTDVSVTSGDTATPPFSPVGAIASRGAAVGGEGVRRAADEGGRGLTRVAAQMHGARPEEVAP